jgi:LysM repeat protein
MNRINLIFSIFALLWLLPSFAQAGDGDNKITRQQYIEMWSSEAVKQMHKHGVPASITLAQGLLESADGNSMLARKGNNHFGIKCHGWDGPGIYKDDDKKNECFRKYKNAHESYEDHSLFLQKPRYAFLFDYKITDYKAWAHGLKQAGYATNPKYPELLIKIIEENNLQRFDTGGKSKKPVTEQPKPKTNPAKHNSKDGNTVEWGIGREIFLSDNKVKFVFAKSGDTYESIAKSMDLAKWQLVKYNDATGSQSLKDGERVYIQPKRAKAVQGEYVVEGNETLRDISQMYGVKMKNLLKYNGMTSDGALKSGQRIKLKK